jgi:hypothetical protein
MSDFDPVRVLRTLHQHQVDFVLVGGLAATAHGSSLLTGDADITPSRRSDNLERLASALQDLGARLRTDRDPEGVPFPVDAAFLAAQPLMLNLTTVAGDLDLTFAPSAFPGGYDQLLPNAVQVHIIDEAETAVASLDDIIRSKAAANRGKDLAALPYLRALQREIKKQA